MNNIIGQYEQDEEDDPEGARNAPQYDAREDIQNLMRLPDSSPGDK